MTTMTARQMTRATWYKHRFSVVAIPAVFLLAALALFADGVVQRHWLSVHHLSGCLVADATTGGSSCGSAAWVSFISPSPMPNVIAVAALALPLLVGLFAGVPWVAREVESGARNVDNILTNTMLPEVSRQILGRLAERQKLAPIHVSIGEDGAFVYN